MKRHSHVINNGAEGFVKHIQFRKSSHPLRFFLLSWLRSAKASKDSSKQAMPSICFNPSGSNFAHQYQQHHISQRLLRHCRIQSRSADASQTAEDAQRLERPQGQPWLCRSASLLLCLNLLQSRP
jgi:hypothetical protein